jgi:hypothetical protein
VFDFYANHLPLWVAWAGLRESCGNSDAFDIAVEAAVRHLINHSFVNGEMMTNTVDTAPTTELGRDLKEVFVDMLHSLGMSMFPLSMVKGFFNSSFCQRSAMSNC